MSYICELNRLLQAHLNDMTQGATYLYEVELDKDALWTAYLEAIPARFNPFFRQRRAHDCSACRHFIRQFGNVVSIRDGKVITIWDIDTKSEEYQPAFDAAAAFVRQHPVANVFCTRFARMGTPQSTDRSDATPITWNHLSVTVPEHIFNAVRRRDANAFQAEMRDARAVFERGLTELSMYSLEAIDELIAQGTVYRGVEWKQCIRKYIELKQAWQALRTDAERALFAWEQSAELNVAWCKLFNTSMGTLLQDLTAGVELETALRRYETITAPRNYRRPKPIFTPKMLAEAEKTISALGYLDSLPRRHATLQDVPAEALLYCRRGITEAAKVQPRLSGVFADMIGDAVPTTKKPAEPAALARVESITIERFLRDVLPTAKGLEVMLENRHATRMMSLIAPVNAGAPSMFTWDNAISWAYAGNVTDSTIRENVKAAGGRVDGVLRFSIQWNDGVSYNSNDFDAHCESPCHHIFFGSKVDGVTGGNLDVDIIHPSQQQVAVENITWPAKNRMRPGKYTFYVHCYSDRGGQDGFKGEIEFDGQVYSFEYPYACTTGQKVPVGVVTMDAHGQFSFQPQMITDRSTRDMWGVPMNEFVPVTMVMRSPNYWGKGNGVGHEHYFFILQGCKNPEDPNGFYNEFLRHELAPHSRVLEALAARMKLAPSDEQLSGVGFSATTHGNIIVQVTGVTKRRFRLEF